ncbi:hypothetical protein [Mixta calida]|nr:hypothetical protein [Mixta calida]
MLLAGEAHLIFATALTGADEGEPGRERASLAAAVAITEASSVVSIASKRISSRHARAAAISVSMI